MHTFSDHSPSTAGHMTNSESYETRSTKSPAPIEESSISSSPKDGPAAQV